MFTELFCNCILYPGVFEGVKLGTGKVWEKIGQEKKRGFLSPTDIELYNMIEDVCRKLVFNCPDDKIYAGCEFLCDSWIRTRNFEEADIRKALFVMDIMYSKEDVDNWKEILDKEINTKPELTNSAIQRKLDEILKVLNSLKGSTSEKKYSAQLLEDAIDFSKKVPKFFTEIGKEKTVYSGSIAEDGYKVRISFEPVRTRPEIPAFGGICYLLAPPVDISQKTKLCISMEFLDKNISQITLELKKTEHKEPDDEMKYVLHNRKEGICDYVLDLDACPKKIKESLGEIVLATDVTDFSDDNLLYAEIVIYRMEFM